MKPSERIFMGWTLGAATLAATVAVFLIAREARDPGPGPAWRYDVSSFQSVDPALLAYRETGRFHLGFTNARGLAVDARDHIYAVGDHAVRVFDADGTLRRSRDLPGAPRCIAVAVDGRVLVGIGNRVAVWHPEDDRLEQWEETGTRGRITSIAVLDDTVLVADAGNRSVSIHGLDGTRHAVLVPSPQSDTDPGLVVPSPHLDVAFAPDGSVRVVNPGRLRIEAWTLDGRQLWTWGQASFGINGFSGCCNPTDIAILASGKVVTSEKGLPRIKVHQDGSGELLAVVAGPEAFDEKAAGIDLAVDSQDRILALDPLRGEAVTYEKKP